MNWPMDELKGRFGFPQNADVVGYLEREGPSAHSDIGSELLEAGKSLPEFHWYCPNGGQYAYLFLHTREGGIFAVAVGMKTVVFRLPGKAGQMATGGGGEIFSSIGGEWVAFDYFNPALSRVDEKSAMARWCGEAFRLAKA